MRVWVFHNSGSKSMDAAHALSKKLQAAGFQVSPARPEVVITVGGDGTLLSAFHRYNASLDSIRFVGVHTGHLVFTRTGATTSWTSWLPPSKPTRDNASVTRCWTSR